MVLVIIGVGIVTLIATEEVEMLKVITRANIN